MRTSDKQARDTRPVCCVGRTPIRTADGLGRDARTIESGVGRIDRRIDQAKRDTAAARGGLATPFRHGEGRTIIAAAAAFRTVARELMTAVEIVAGRSRRRVFTPEFAQSCGACATTRRKNANDLPTTQESGLRSRLNLEAATRQALESLVVKPDGDKFGTRRRPPNGAVVIIVIVIVVIISIVIVVIISIVIVGVSHRDKRFGDHRRTDATDRRQREDDP